MVDFDIRLQLKLISFRWSNSFGQKTQLQNRPSREILKNVPRAILSTMMRAILRATLSESKSKSEADGDSRVCAQAHKRMLINADVYALADKYNLPELKKLAIEKFRRDSRQSPFEDLAAIADRVYDSTPSNDRGLRDVVTRICKRYFDHDGMKDAKLAIVVKNIAVLGYDIAKVAIGKYKKQATVNEETKQALDKLQNEHWELDRQFWEVVDAMEFVTATLKEIFKATKVKVYNVCEFCSTTEDNLEWVDDESRPYLKLCCPSCNGDKFKDMAEYAKYRSLGLLDYYQKNEHSSIW